MTDQTTSHHRILENLGEGGMGCDLMLVEPRAVEIAPESARFVYRSDLPEIDRP